jgi:ribonucleases P/MRP protein subunit RPP40
MVHGKKGFERLMWAAKNVLNRSLSWLFYDPQDTDGDGDGGSMPGNQL